MLLGGALVVGALVANEALALRRASPDLSTLRRRPRRSRGPGRRATSEHPSLPWRLATRA